MSHADPEARRAYNRAWFAAHPEEKRAYGRAYYARNTEKLCAANREYQLKTKYGITVEEYDVMLAAQDGRCLLCHNRAVTRRLAVDHDHITSRIRGLLCTRCNRALGQWDGKTEALQSLADFLVATLEDRRVNAPGGDNPEEPRAPGRGSTRRPARRRGCAGPAKTPEPLRPEPGVARAVLHAPQP